MKVLLDLSERALQKLGEKASIGGRSRKKYMEIVLTVHADTLVAKNKKSNNKK